MLSSNLTIEVVKPADGSYGERWLVTDHDRKCFTEVSRPIIALSWESLSALYDFLLEHTERLMHVTQDLLRYKDDTIRRSLARSACIESWILTESRMAWLTAIWCNDRTVRELLNIEHTLKILAHQFNDCQGYRREWSAT